MSKLPLAKLIVASIWAAVLVVAASGLASGAGTTNGETIGDIVSDVIMGNEPNLIPFEAGNEGPAEVAPGTIGDPAGNAGNEKYVIPSGAPGPITCGEGWFGPAQFAGAPPPPLVGDEGVPGMNVDCSGNETPHTP